MCMLNQLKSSGAHSTVEQRSKFSSTSWNLRDTRCCGDKEHVQQDKTRLDEQETTGSTLLAGQLRRNRVPLGSSQALFSSIWHANIAMLR